MDPFAACPERSRRDRTSAATMRPSQLRLWLSSMAYVLLCAMLAAGRTLTKQTSHSRPPISYTASRLAVVRPIRACFGNGSRLTPSN